MEMRDTMAPDWSEAGSALPRMRKRKGEGRLLEYRESQGIRKREVSKLETWNNKSTEGFGSMLPPDMSICTMHPQRSCTKQALRTVLTWSARSLPECRLACPWARRISFLGQCPELCHTGQNSWHRCQRQIVCQGRLLKEKGTARSCVEWLASPHTPWYLHTLAELSEAHPLRRMSCVERLGKRALTSPTAAAWFRFSKSVWWQGKLLKKHYKMSYKTHSSEQTQADGCQRVLNYLQLIMQTLTLTN